MTTPESPVGPQPSGASPDASTERVRRPEPQASGPDRSATGAASAAREGEAPDPSMTESVAQAVRMGYDVIAENIRQGREAAAKFRQGDYNIRDVPGDVETVVLRLIHLARELSTTTLDVCERLVKEMGPPRPGDGRVNPPPSFWPAQPPPQSASTAEVVPGRIRLTVLFKGEGRATTRTETLDRPRQPTRPQDVFATPLQSRDAPQAAITEVSFGTDVSIDGLVAEVTLPPGAAAGVYSGLVYARNDEVPLGVLTVEILT
jgi:hypothetical protein